MEDHIHTSSWLPKVMHLGLIMRMSNSYTFSFGLFSSLVLAFVSPQAVGQSVPLSGVADPMTYLAKVQSEMTKQWPNNRRVHIVCHGHSVPAGYFKTPVVDSPNAYPHLLFLGLKERFSHAVINVIVTAIGGENSDKGLARFDQDVLTHNPDVITIDYALNDRQIGVEKARANLAGMIDKAKERNIPVILLTPTADEASKMDDPNDPLNQQREMIRALAAQRQVGLVDSLAEFHNAVKSGTPLDTLMSQGNHPNRLGHDLVTAKLLEWFPK
jgi:acyl-CoA thioesterase-1